MVFLGGKKEEAEMKSGHDDISSFDPLQMANQVFKKALQEYASKRMWRLHIPIAIPPHWKRFT